MSALSKAQLDAWVDSADGGLPDGCIEGVSTADWQRFLDLAHAEAWPFWWRGADGDAPVPTDARELIRGGTLALVVGAGVQINVFPGPDPAIAFDFDAREMTGQTEVDALSRFIRTVASRLGKPVRLMAEGATEPFATYDPALDRFVGHAP